MLLAYLIKLFFFFIVPSIPGYIFFSRFFKEENTLKSLVYAIGISPVISLLCLYYFLFLFNGLSPWFYLSIYTLFPFLLPLYKAKKYSLVFPKWHLILALALLFVAVFFYASGKSLTEHDTLEYALQGKHFFNTLSVYYTPYPYHAENGFYYIGLHGFAFPLVFTWELFMNKVLNLEGTILFQSINAIYAILLLCLVYSELKKYGLKYAIIATLLIAFTTGFIFNALQFHLEMLRQFLFLVFIIMFVRSLKSFSLLNMLIFAAIAGLQSTVHSIGAISSVIALAILFIFWIVNVKEKKYLHAFYSSVVLILFGWIHYILDILIGTGWILK